MPDDTTVRPLDPALVKLQDPEVAIDAQLKHQPPKRQKTWGERAFNWGTYGGIALMGNEATSLVITRSADKGAAHHRYKQFESFFKRFDTKAADASALRDYVAGNATKFGESKARLPFLLLATVGGMFMVPFVKYAEDHKGELVRKLDRGHYGSLTDRDPKLIEAHKEMDEAPKQTWSSLGKGRLTTVIMAAVADFTFGWDRAITTKLHPKASLDGIADIVGGLVPKKFEDVAKNGTWLLTLSSTLTVLFYASSKLFAKKQEEKVERKLEKQLARTHGTTAANAETALETAPASEKQNADKPTPQIRSISREETIASAPQLSQGA